MKSLILLAATSYGIGPRRNTRINPPTPILSMSAIASATVADVNGTYIIDENCSAKFTNTGPMETQISATNYGNDETTDGLATVVS